MGGARVDIFVISVSYLIRSYLLGIPVDIRIDNPQVCSCMSRCFDMDQSRTH